MKQPSCQYETQSKLPLGSIVITDDISRHLSTDEIHSGLESHAKSDWGYVPEDIAESNDKAIKGGHRIISAYGKGERKFWIITEADRTKTTVLFPIQY